MKGSRKSNGGGNHFQRFDPLLNLEYLCGWIKGTNPSLGKYYRR
jgi:hypothetical protein